MDIAHFKHSGCEGHMYIAATTVTAVALLLSVNKSCVIVETEVLPTLQVHEAICGPYMVIRGKHFDDFYWTHHSHGNDMQMVLMERYMWSLQPVYRTSYCNVVRLRKHIKCTEGSVQPELSEAGSST